MKCVYYILPENTIYCQARSVGQGYVWSCERVERWGGRERGVFKFCLFLVKTRGSCGTEKCWKGGLMEQLRELEKEVPEIPAAYYLWSS